MRKPCRCSVRCSRAGCTSAPRGRLSSKRARSCATPQAAPGAPRKRLRQQRRAGEQGPAVPTGVRGAAESVDASLRRAELVGLLFGGLSLASILLLAALGLAITFGLMGVINMAHGELLMIGAYATWLVQSAFRGSRFFGWYLAPPSPPSFPPPSLAAALPELPLVLH